MEQVRLLVILQNLRQLTGHKKNININSTKSMTGHLLGATGAQEAIYSIMMMQDSFIAPSINIDNIVDEADGIHINTETLSKNISSVMSNSFGFGGTNASLSKC